MSTLTTYSLCLRRLSTSANLVFRKKERVSFCHSVPDALLAKKKCLPTFVYEVRRVQLERETGQQDTKFLSAFKVQRKHQGVKNKLRLN